MNVEHAVVERCAHRGFLLAECAQAYSLGIASAAPPLRLDDKFNALHLLRLAKNLALGEIGVLMTATERREAGLSLARAGIPSKAWEFMRVARSLCAEADLSIEAQLVASSFQLAAEAFVWFKTGSHREAETALCAALEAAVRLHDEFGYDIEVRRIHLLRNLVRVFTESGRSEDALVLALKLLSYIECPAAWPSPYGAVRHPPDALSVDEQDAMLDQVLGEITLLLERQRELSGKLADFDLECQPSRARLRLAALAALTEADSDRFLKIAARFFVLGPGQMLQTWRAMESQYGKLADSFLKSSPTATKHSGLPEST